MKLLISNLNNSYKHAGDNLNERRSVRKDGEARRGHLRSRLQGQG